MHVVFHELFGVFLENVVYLIKNPRLVEPAHPTIVYAIANDADRKVFSALVRGRYAPDQSVFFLAGSGDREQQVVSARVKDAEAKLLSLDLGTVMYLPPRQTGPRKARSE